jgi:hypothetical protein
MARIVPDNGKEKDSSGTNHTGSKNRHCSQIISTEPLSQAYNAAPTRREPSISGPMIIGVRQQAEACGTLVGRLGNHGMAMSLFSGID